jgi:multidrug resistance efflux pump
MSGRGTRISARRWPGTPLGASTRPNWTSRSSRPAPPWPAPRRGGAGRTTAARWNDLLTSNSVSHQEADEKNAAAAANAAVAEAQANLGRLLAMKAYATVRAPFAGVVTRATPTSAIWWGRARPPSPMFAMADEQRMRIYVNVPQQYSAQMRPGLTAT